MGSESPAPLRERLDLGMDAGFERQDCGKRQIEVCLGAVTSLGEFDDPFRFGDGRRKGKNRLSWVILI